MGQEQQNKEALIYAIKADKLFRIQHGQNNTTRYLIFLHQAASKNNITEKPFIVGAALVLLSQFLGFFQT